MRFLGIDYGNKRIGISISDESNAIANPYTTIINKDFKTVISQIVKIIKDEEITDIVIGIPLSFEFSNTEQTELTQKFINYLKLKLPEINTHVENEILSTREAENKLDNINNKKSIIDQTASCLILQGYIDKNQYGK
jgi:putative holliday junction resolvase